MDTDVYIIPIITAVYMDCSVIPVAKNGSIVRFKPNATNHPEPTLVIVSITEFDNFCVITYL